MRKSEKIEVVKKLREQVEHNQAILLADYRGLTVEQLSDLRRRLRKTGAEFRVIKNRLLIKAIEGMPIESLSRYLRGPVAVALHPDDPAAPARVLTEFAKESEKLELRGGAVEGEVLDGKNVALLAKLPGRQELRSTVAGQINMVMGVVTTSIDALLQEIVGLVEARAKTAGEAA